jgi:hypothetical protein
MSVPDQLTSALAGRYTIERQVGEGGMATVYLARDVKHNRRVALKVLRPELGFVLGPERFLSEIETTANLQHPHLLPLFDSGEADGLLFFVMPFVEGETLRHRLERERQLPIDEAIRLATSVASALDYAHRHHVIHRDLKPENILLHDGQPLVTDFGIALAVSNAGGSRITQTGLSLGTPQYMSPEQATGDRVLDARSDIYSLGCVLFEMLTGDAPHSASTSQAIIAKVLTEKAPSARTLRDTVPEHIDLAIQKALSKLAADRFATAAEFADALTGVRPMSSRSTLSAGGPAADDAARRAAFPGISRAVRWSGWTLAASALVAGGVWGAIWFRPAPPAQPARFEVPFPDTVQLGTSGSTTIILSRDGSKLVFAGSDGAARGLFLRRLDDPAPQFIRGTEGAAIPTFSPGGDWVLFMRAGALVKVPVQGGAALTVVDSAATGGSSWGDAGEIVFRDPDYVLWRVSENGGSRTLLARPDSTRQHRRYSTPNVLPGGRAALITIFKGNRVTAGTQLTSELGVVSIPDGEVTELGIPGSYPRYMAPGYLVFGRPDGSILAAPFSRRRLRVTGPAVPVLEGTAVFANGVAAIAIAQNGTMAYIASTAAGMRPLVAVTRKGVARPFADEKRDFLFPRLSPDGRRVAASVGTGQDTDIWTYDIASRTLAKLTHDGASTRPDWSPNGQRVAYMTTDSAGSSIKWQSWDGSGVPEVLLRPPGGVGQISFGPARGYVAFRSNSGAGGVSDRDIWIAPIDSIGAARPFLATPALERQPRISPNGRLLAYVSNESGSHEVYVRPMPGPGGRIKASANGGVEPVWAPGGRELLFRSSRHVMSASIAEQPELSVTRRDTLFVDEFLRNPDHQSYDVFPDGRELLMLGQERSESKLFVVVNWTEELKRRLRGSSSR